MGTINQFGLRLVHVAACTLVLLFALSSGPAGAQSFSWGDAGSTTSTSDYSLSTNWGTPPSGAPPVTAGTSASFGGLGSTTVDVTTVTKPDSWLIGQSYTFNGGEVKFSVAGPSGGILSSTSSGTTVTINNNIGESVAGVVVQQFGDGTLVLAGTNTYTGGTRVSAGILQVQTSASVGTGVVTLWNNGTFQAGADLTIQNPFSIAATGGIIDSNGFALTIGGQIKDDPLLGPGVVEFQDTFGGGVTILTGNSTYTGGTTICGCATLQLGTTTQKASLIGDIENLGTLIFTNADTSGIKTITNDFGLVIFQNNTTASSAIIANNQGEIDFGTLVARVIQTEGTVSSA